MPEQITQLQTPLYETTGERGPRVLHDLARFELLTTLCHVRTNPEGDTLVLSVGRREFQVSLLDLAATAALAVDAQIRTEIRARVIASRATPQPTVAVPLRGTVGADGTITPNGGR